MDNLRGRGQNVKNIAFTKEGGWVIFYAKNGYSHYNIPVEMTKKIKDLVQNGSTLNHVFFLNDKWIIVYDDYKYKSNL